MANTSGFELKGRNWNTLNKMMNESPELNNMLDTAADAIYFSALGRIQSSGSTATDFVEAGLDSVTLEPSDGVGVRIRIISLPSIGFEMKYNPLKGGLDATGSH